MEWVRKLYSRCFTYILEMRSWRLRDAKNLAYVTELFCGGYRVLTKTHLMENSIMHVIEGRR